MSAHTVTTTTTVLGSLGLAMRSWTRPEPEKTFWSDLCKACQETSCERSVVRSLGSSQAWDVAGPVLWHWNETLHPVVKEYFDRNKSTVLKRDDWLASIDCWMVGAQIANAKPTVVITCSAGGVAKRLKRLMRDDQYIQGSGFAFVGRRGGLRLAMRSGAAGKEDHDRPQDVVSGRAQWARGERGSRASQERSDVSSHRYRRGESPPQVAQRMAQPAPDRAYESREDPRSPQHMPDGSSVKVYDNPVVPREGSRHHSVATIAERRHFIQDERSSGPRSGATVTSYAYAPTQPRISTKLSTLAEDFAKIGLARYDECERFIWKHPEILMQPPNAFLDAAQELIRAGRTEDAQRCIQQLLIIRQCEKLGRTHFLRKLVREDDETLKDFLSDFRQMYGTLMKRASPQQSGPTRVEAMRQSEAYDLLTRSLINPASSPREDSSNQQVTRRQGLDRHEPQPMRHEELHEPRWGNSKRDHGRFADRSFGEVAGDDAPQPPSLAIKQQQVTSKRSSATYSGWGASPTRSLEAQPRQPSVTSTLAVSVTEERKPGAEHQVSGAMSQKPRKQQSTYEQKRQVDAEVVAWAKATSDSRSSSGDSIHVTSEGFEEKTRLATLGGQILVKDQLWDLTVSHIFLRGGTSMSERLGQHESSSVSSTSQIFSLNSDSEEDDEASRDDAGWRQEARTVHLRYVQVESSSDKFLLADRLRVLPPLSMEGDWALLFPQKSPRRQSDNGIGISSDYGKRPMVSRAEGLERTQRVLVLRGDKNFMTPRLGPRCQASASLSLICLPGSKMLQSAQSVEMSCMPGDSGAWVVDYETYAWYGTVVAYHANEESHAYMIPSRDILASISQHHDGYVGLPEIKKRFCQLCRSTVISARVPNGRYVYGGECSACQSIL